MVLNSRSLLKMPVLGKSVKNRYQRTPFLPHNEHMLRPEDKFNRRYRYHPMDIFIYQYMKKGLKERFWRYTELVFDENRVDLLIHKYSQQIYLQKVFVIFLIGQVFGALLFYLNHKIMVIEPHMVEEYGRDYPHKRNLLPVRLYHEYRIKWFYFQQYNLTYFYDEQQIDFVNRGQLDTKTFFVYSMKRLNRAIEYDKIRDPSFDFLDIGEDDTDDYDDFV